MGGHSVRNATEKSRSGRTDDSVRKKALRALADVGRSGIEYSVSASSSSGRTASQRHITVRYIMQTDVAEDSETGPLKAEAA